MPTTGLQLPARLTASLSSCCSGTAHQGTLRCRLCCCVQTPMLAVLHQLVCMQPHEPLMLCTQHAGCGLLLKAAERLSESSTASINTAVTYLWADHLPSNELDACTAQICSDNVNKSLSPDTLRTLHQVTATINPPGLIDSWKWPC